MPGENKFPHLAWTHSGPFIPKYGPGRKSPPEVEKAKERPKQHSENLSGQLGKLREIDESQREEREESGLPEIKGHGFLLKVPEDTDVDTLAHAIGVELVAETEHGLMFGASENLDLAKFEEVLRKFGINEHGGGAAASIIEVFHDREDTRKLSEILVGDVFRAWPFGEKTLYTFDLGIQTADSTKEQPWTRLPQRRTFDDDESYQKEVERIRRDDRMKADDAWHSIADERMEQINSIIEFYEGEILDGMRHESADETRTGIVFPDSIQIRVKMSGAGFRDLVANFPHLFEVALPPDVRFLAGSAEVDPAGSDLEILPPADDAPRVCVIDSGIQEEHRWLEPAIDREVSRCHIPDKEPDDVADYVSPRGHGTRVAGAVLYPDEVPKDGEEEAIAWLQNARVLDENNFLPLNLPPVNYLEDIVSALASRTPRTKLFNHSITDNGVCESGRMSAWAAKLDDLSHRKDVLFLQSSGNLDPLDSVNEFGETFTHPEQLLCDSAKISSPAQSLHALTVGSVSSAYIDQETWQSCATEPGHPSSFSRCGHSPLWSVIKPEVVEYGGEYLLSYPERDRKKTTPDSAPELVASTLHGEPAISRDDVGTSFSAPKVAHLAARLQTLFPDASPQLYRALIVHSAQWPNWAEADTVEVDSVLRTIGYGIPSLERATTNSPSRITMVTPDSTKIFGKQYHLFQIPIPEEIRLASLESKVRIDVTLAYTASPRRTRSRRTGYLETWLDWRSINNGEPLDHFVSRMGGEKERDYPGFRWRIHQDKNHGETTETRRDLGSVQKDWTYLEANALPEDFAIAVRAHTGWNHKENAGSARYCLVVSFESLGAELPIYSAIRSAVEVEIEPEVRAEV